MQQAGNGARPAQSGRRGRRRFRPRISLRFLLMLTTVVAFFLGRHLHRAQQQERAVATILDAGGSVRYDYQEEPMSPINWVGVWLPKWIQEPLGDDFFHSVVEVDMVNRRPYGVWGPLGTGFAPIDFPPLDFLAGMPHLKKLMLHSSQVTDESVAHIRQLRHLESLSCFGAGTWLSDVGFARLGGLSKLQVLRLPDCDVTDASLELTSRFQDLESLRLHSPHLTDEGVRHLGKLVALNALSVGNPEHPEWITDDSLVCLLDIASPLALTFDGVRPSPDLKAKLLAKSPPILPPNRVSPSQPLTQTQPGTN
ncbi:MAG: hypothetical protein AAFU85_17415 [Planctomycetota bacterium]